jgi:hypothetical protein
LTTFSSDGPFYGDDLPDLAFVQLKVRGLPPLKLDQEKQTIRAGRKIATAGFPMGTGPLIIKGKVTQLTPTLRHGIISGVYPFPCPRPHGFTIDVLSQGGASGSPVFLEDAPLVVGMIESVIADAENITLALPSHLIAWGLSSCLANIPPSTDDAPTLDELIDKSQPGDQLDWESYVVKKP